MLDFFAQLVRRLRYYWRPGAFDRDLEDEMRFHLAMKIEANLKAGMTPPEAAREARRHFGNQTLLREESRNMWTYQSIESLSQDLRFSLRIMSKSPGFTAIAVMTVALGIGANTAIFSVVNGVLLRPLPYRQPGRIVAIEEIGKEGKRIQVAPANFLDWRAQNTVFDHMAAIFEHWATLSTGAAGAQVTTAGSAAGDSSPVVNADDAKRISLAMTSANFFEVFGIQPRRGRLFLPEDEQAGHPAIAVISHRLWQRRFGGDPEIVGKSINLDGGPYTVIGIGLKGFDYPNGTEVWVPPYLLAPALNPSMDVTRVRGWGFLSTVALLKPGVTLKQAGEEMELITARLREQYPETNNNRFDRVVSLHSYLVGNTSTALWLLLGAVGFVLLVACANVANLMLVRATARQKEIALRSALGASRLRLVRQLLTESVTLSLTGGGSGLLLAWWGLKLVTGLLPKDFPRLASIKLDLPVLWFTMAVSLATGVLFGLAPAWQVSSTKLVEPLKETSRGATSASNRFRGLLVVSEVAVSLVLLVGAGLLFRSFLRLRSVKAGFNPDHVLTLRVGPSGPNFQEASQLVAYYRQAEERLRRIPGVDLVGAIDTLPLFKGPIFAFRVEGRPPLPIDQWPPANYRNASPDYFRTLGIPILRGRSFEPGDTASAPLVVIINQVVAEIDRGQPVADIFPMKSLVAESISQQRFNLTLLFIFAGIALLLSSAGVYGVMAYTVSKRTHEIGIRVALGARERDVLKMVLRQGLLLAVTGISIGLLASLALTRFLASLVFAVSVTDPMTFAAIPLILTVVALLACYVPARRALRIDPTQALRYE